MSLTESKGSAAASAFAKDQPYLWDLQAIASAFYPRFTILELLDESEDSAIFLAQDERARSASLDPLLKLKVLSEHSQLDRKKLELFYLEARAAAKLSHKNIIKTSEAEQIGSLHFCTIEHKPDCESLRSLLDLRAWLDTQLAAAITLQIAEALDYAHGQGVVHLKLQPENILIDPEGTALLTDFGIEVGDGMRWAHQERTQSMPAFYCSPEQASDQDVDAVSDLYSLGIILYEMLTDRVPFDYQNPDVIRHKHRTQMPEPPDVFRSDLPAPVSAVVMSLLEKQLIKRPQTPAHLQAVLNRIIQKQEIPEIGEIIDEADQPGLVSGVEAGSPEPDAAIVSLNEPILDIGIDREILSSPVVDEDETVTLSGDEMPPLESALSYQEENSNRVGWDKSAHLEDDLSVKPAPHVIESGTARKRERFEPPTITVIEPPLSESVGHIPIAETPAKIIASQQETQAVTGRRAPAEIRVKLFLVLLIIIVAALALSLADRDKLFRFFGIQTPQNPPAEETKEGSTEASQPAKPPINGAENRASFNDPSTTPSEKSGWIGTDKKRTTSSAQVAATRSYLQKPVVRAAPRKIRKNRAKRPVTRVRGRAFRN